MEKLNIEKAKKFCEETLIKLEDKENAKFIILHSRLVGEIALVLAEHKKVNREILEIAGWVHDVGKVISTENHPAHSIEILEKNFELDEILRDCIVNHGIRSQPKTEEGKIFRIADKSCILHPELIKNLVNSSEERYEKTLKFIRDICMKAPNLLESFER